MREIATKVVRDLTLFLRVRKLPEDALRREFPRLWQRVEAPVTEPWTAWEEFAPFMTAYVAVVREAGALDDCNRFLMRAPGTAIGQVAGLIRLFSDGRKLYHLMASQIGHRNFRQARAGCVDRPDGRVEVTVELLRGCAPCRAWFEMVASGFRVLPGIIGLPDARIETEISELSATYVVELTSSRTLLQRLGWGRPVLRESYEQLLRSESELSKLRLELERRVEERTRELEAAKDAAEAANRAKSAFLANVSHELRTPLAAILGFAELMGQGHEVTEAGEAHRLAIERNGRHLLALISDLLDLSLIEAGQLSLNRQSFDALDELAGAVSTLRPRAEAKGVRLVTRISPTLPARLVTDPLRLRQILLNVIGNAVKFTAKGEIEVAARLAREDRACLEVTITDSGTGVPPELHEAIFDPFVQADQSLRREHEGVGLGLALARRLARRLGGDVTLTRSAPGQGSVFTVRVRAD